MLAQRPPMGWNTWNTFGKDIDEKLIMETADIMVNKGYLAAGYEYLVIDDCWSLHERDADGKIVADPEKFPHGMKYVADYVHGKGLKFGMYSCAGRLTCAGYPGSYGHEYVDAETFAGFGVDYLKYDFCHFPQSGNCKHAYQTMSMALKASGREILFSACNWGVQEPWNWMRSVGAHMYRSTGDIFDGFVSFRDIMDSQMDKFCMSAPGCFNDVDMLICGMAGTGNVGRGGCSEEEYKTHFGLWCLFGAPLMIGADIRNVDEKYRALMQNPHLISLNQDEECRPPYILKTNHWLENNTRRFIRHLSGNRFALALVNFGDQNQYLEYDFDDAGVPFYTGYGFAMTDMFTGESFGTKTDGFRVEVPAHGMKLWEAELVRVK